MDRNGLSKGVKYTSLQQVINTIKVESVSSRTKNALIAFVTRWIINGEEDCRESYTPSNYWKLKSEMKKILGVNELLLGDKVLPPLNVISIQKRLPL
ncbi:hypothetical protein UB32_07985 [Mesobacillus subterraneus]|uniref:Uncharacterized protein n=1 Tax=Mesobacillus subterraneus TaxID=285983 RepID=A0A0D6ZBW6_9BACI|nr:hypothetical protein UB32_07985 [Mesobacillus subterraneus]